MELKRPNLVLRLAGWLAVLVVALSGTRAGAYVGSPDLFKTTGASNFGTGVNTTMPLTGACGPDAATCAAIPLSNTTYAVPVDTNVSGNNTTISVVGTVNVAGATAGTNDICTGSPSTCLTVSVVNQAGSLCTGGACMVSIGATISIPGANRPFSAKLVLNPANFVNAGTTAGWLLLAVTAADTNPVVSETEYIRVDYTPPAVITPQVCFFNPPGENERRTVEGVPAYPRYVTSNPTLLMSGRVKPNTGAPTPAAPNLNGVGIYYGGAAGTLQTTYTGPYAAEAADCTGAVSAGWLNFQKSVALGADSLTDVYLNAQNSLGVTSADDLSAANTDDLFIVRDASDPVFGSAVQVRDISNTLKTVSGGAVSVTNASNFVSIEGSFSDAAPGRVHEVAIETTAQAITAAQANATAGATTTSIPVTALTGGTLSAVTDYYKGWTVKFTGGALAGQTQVVSGYNGGTKTFTTAAFTGAPANGDGFSVSPMTITQAQGTAAAGSTATTLAGAGTLSAVDGFYNGWAVTFTSGPLAGQTKAVSQYIGATKVFTTAAFTGAASVGNAFTVSNGQTVTLHNNDIAAMSTKAALKVSDIVQFVNVAGQLNQGLGARITQMTVAGANTTLTLAPNATDGTPIVWDPNASFLIRHTGVTAMKGVLSGCPGACVLGLVGGAGAALTDKDSFDSIFNTALRGGAAVAG